MTTDQWDEHFNQVRLHLVNDRGIPSREAFLRARTLTEKRLGPRPGVSIELKLALWWLERKLRRIEPMQIPMFVQKLFASAIYAITAGAAAYNLAISDGVITGQEWGAIAVVVLPAFWGKFSTNTRLIAASRKGESVNTPAPEE